MGRIRQAPGGAAAALAACVIVVTGCGGGGDDSTSTSPNATVPQVTSPGEFNPGGASTTTPDRPGGSSTAPGGPPGQSAPGLPAQHALAPFRECLQQHGVSLPFLNGSGGQEQQREFQQNPQQYRAEVQKAFACIPKLPQQLRATAERFKQRFEEQQAPGSGGTNG